MRSVARVAGCRGITLAEAARRPVPVEPAPPAQWGLERPVSRAPPRSSTSLSDTMRTLDVQDSRPRFTASRTIASSRASGTAPSTETCSLMMVFGTPQTLYRCATSGNSRTSITSAVTCGLSTASSWASLAARGQCGQVGVTSTRMWTGDASLVTCSRVAALSDVAPRAASMRLSTSTLNSYPAGTPK